jgi:hypothetical protein
MAIRTASKAATAVTGTPIASDRGEAATGGQVLYAYKLKRIFFNGWNGWSTVEQFLDSIGDIDEGDEYIDGWRTRVAQRLDVVSSLFAALGWTDEKGPIWFAPLPVADGPLAESEYMIAVETDDATFVASPFELPWLASGALDSRRSDRLVSKALN